MKMRFFLHQVDAHTSQLRTMKKPLDGSRASELYCWPVNFLYQEVSLSQTSSGDLKFKWPLHNLASHAHHFVESVCNGCSLWLYTCLFFTSDANNYFLSFIFKLDNFFIQSSYLQKLYGASKNKK
jgi:hypothetical protein